MIEDKIGHAHGKGGKRGVGSENNLK